jgi:hypothetical protein
MSTTLIKTPNGLTTDWQAFDKITSPGFSPALQISYLSQLTDVNIVLAHEAAGWIVANLSEKESSKVIRTAKEILTGLPIGIKYLGKWEQYVDFFRYLPPGSRVSITFTSKESKIREIASLMHGSRRCLTFNQGEVTMFLGCVVASGRWEGILKTFQVMVCDMRPSDMEVLAHYMVPCVESIELIYTLGQLERAIEGTDSPFKEKLNELKERHSDVEYDKDLFLKAVREMDYPQAEAWADSFAPNEPMEKVLEKFHSDYGRIVFFKKYVFKFDMLMAS